ncbi:hypothetical protein PCANC_11807 [Puccinia coronata f. sp. avenae]|uniref:Tet-like 2OG-Fe(II) oxygenase domain-containing protein n=1 Tax=Puccinia coronata f. sp. avenae TaxID=200324 RepID=A0A2N5SV92_9BASI|nr:hypothetical protein PCANC_11807 [Puccinia coronata f. sp. avenae]
MNHPVEMPYVTASLNQVTQTQNDVKPPRRLIQLTKACAKKYLNPPPNTLETPICKSCPGEAHDPLECVKDIQRRCPRLPSVSGLPFRIGQSPLIKNAPTTCAPCPQPAPENLLNKLLRHRAFKSAQQLQHQNDANLKFAGQEQIMAHVCRKNRDINIRMFHKSFIAYADSCCKHIVAIVKFYPFATMDSSLMARFQNLSHHLIAQSKFQNPNYSNGPAYAGHLFSLGWRKAYESKTTVGITRIAEKVSRDRKGWEDLQTHLPEVNRFIGERFEALSKPLFDEVKDHFQPLEAPGLSPDFITNPDAFTCHLSFTLNNFANQCHSDRDSSPYTFFTWLPINKSTGQLVEGPLVGFGGEFVFPKHGFGIDFSGFQGVVECAWKATHFAHLTLPSTTPISSSHT